MRNTCVEICGTNARKYSELIVFVFTIVFAYVLQCFRAHLHLCYKLFCMMVCFAIFCILMIYLNQCVSIGSGILILVVVLVVVVAVESSRNISGRESYQ
jgi:uncharacterized membrane protein